MKFAMVSGWDAGFNSLAAVTWPNKQKYCARHGYDAVHLPSLEPSVWAKPLAAVHYLPQYDWICAIDVDTLITNMDIKVESFLPAEGPDFLTSIDDHGLNTGIMFWRNTPWANQYWRKILDARRYFKHWICSEQTTIAYTLYREPKDKWQICPQRQFNSYRYSAYANYDPNHVYENEHKPGDFILHLPGITNHNRINIFKDYQTSEALAAIKTIKCHTEDNDLRRVCIGVIDSGSGTVVEFGTAFGASAKAMATIARKVITIDSFAPVQRYDWRVPDNMQETALKNLHKEIASGEVVQIPLDSRLDREALLNRLMLEISSPGADMTFIDADHEYDGVRNDIEISLKVLRPGGLISGHDFQYEPVRRAVADTIGSVNSHDSLWWKWL